MTKDEQARDRLVEIAQERQEEWSRMRASAQAELRDGYRIRAGFKNPRKGHFCAAGLTAAMEDAGLVVPAPGTPARRGAVALLDFVWAGDAGLSHDRMARWSSGDIAPGDIIAWLQYPPGKDPAGWRRGHVAMIVAVDDESLTTVGWNEGAAPGRVMRRRLWRKHYMEVPRVPPQNTVLHRKSKGMLYGIARPVAR